jgi:hypothetical protein
MTKARDIANIISTGVSNSLINLDANEIPSLDASKIATGTISNSRLTGSGAITINGSAVSLGGTVTIDPPVFTETIVTPTSGQTTFATTYIVGYVQVLVNGIKLLNGVDFTATNGTSIVLTSGVQTSDRVEIIKFK